MQHQTNRSKETKRLPLLDLQRPRIAAFRQEIVQEIPCNPAEARNNLALKPL